MKPSKWQDCPSEILEDILSNIDLEYDHYESSKAEEIHIILNSRLSNRINEYLLEDYWNKLTEIQFVNLINSKINAYKSQIAYLEVFISSLVDKQ